MSQSFKTGDGLYGDGIYFANNLEAAQLKVKNHKGHVKWTFLIVDVYFGKYITLKKEDANKIDTKVLLNQGISSIVGYNQATCREIVCLNPERIHNIKYIYGMSPRHFS